MALSNLNPDFADITHYTWMGDFGFGAAEALGRNCFINFQKELSSAIDGFSLSRGNVNAHSVIHSLHFHWFLHLFISSFSSYGRSFSVF